MVTDDLEQETFAALRRLAIASAEFRAAKSRFDTLIRLRDAVLEQAVDAQRRTDRADQ